jgi:hypothetical protein
MTEEPHDEGKPQKPRRPGLKMRRRSRTPVRNSAQLYIATALILSAHSRLRLVRNPYTQSVTEGGGFTSTARTIRL